MSLRKKIVGTTLILGLMMAAGAPAVALAEDQPAAAAAPAPVKHIKKRTPKRSGKTGLARPSGSLEQRHQVCLSFIRRHNLDCDPWQTPTCGADTGFFRPPECVRPRSQ